MTSRPIQLMLLIGLMRGPIIIIRARRVEQYFSKNIIKSLYCIYVILLSVFFRYMLQWRNRGECFWVSGHPRRISRGTKG